MARGVSSVLCDGLGGREGALRGRPRVYAHNCVIVQQKVAPHTKAITLNKTRAEIHAT